MEIRNLISIFWLQSNTANSPLRLFITPHRLAELMHKLHDWGKKEVGYFDAKIKCLLNEIDHNVLQGDRLKEAMTKTNLLQVQKDQETFLDSTCQITMDQRE